MRFVEWLLVSVLSVGVYGCSESKEVPEAEIPVAPPLDDGGEQSALPEAASSDEAVRTGPFEKSFEGIRFQIPEGWKEVELAKGQSGFLLARFLIPAAGTEVELTCSKVGGGIDANMNRWIGEVRLAPGESAEVQTIDVGGTEAKWVDLAGTYNGSSSGKRRQLGYPDWRVVGVGIPMQPQDFYLKLNGPRDGVAEIYDAFRESVKSAQLD